MDLLPYIYIGKDAVKEITRFCVEHERHSFVLVTDQTVYRVLGAQVEAALRKAGWDVQLIILNGDPVIPDDRYLIKIITPLDNSQRTFISVGSGTITDMTRYVAYRTKSDFISVPTAPSMDGYASNTSALTVDGMKLSIFSKPPIAIIADTEVLSQAPRRMISAGLGDTLGKYTALADWSLGGLLWNDAYSAEIVARVRKNLMRCVGLLDDVESKWDELILALTESLIDVGTCMLITGNSRPASGSEHSLSHYWELKLMREGRPVSFHGLKVGFASLLIARRYELIRSISVTEAQKLMADTRVPSTEEELTTIRKIYGPISDDIIRIQKAFLQLDRSGIDKLRIAIAEHWDAIQAIAATVPSEDEMRRLLLKAGIPTQPEQLHLTQQDLEEAILYGHYIRNPFTVIKLSRILGINDRF
jgi:glycerol-1-phosphate dehydrogenase [NAD(P)+]